MREEKSKMEGAINDIKRELLELKREVSDEDVWRVEITASYHFFSAGYDGFHLFESSLSMLQSNSIGTGRPEEKEVDMRV